MIRGGYWGGAWGLSWGGTWGEAWLLLNQPYQELSLKGQVFVRSYLTRIHSIEVAEQIVSVAALNNISAIDAEKVVVVSTKRIAQNKATRTDTTQAKSKFVSALVKASPQKIFSQIRSPEAGTERIDYIDTAFTQRLVLVIEHSNSSYIASESSQVFSVTSKGLGVFTRTQYDTIFAHETSSSRKLPR